MKIYIAGPITGHDNFREKFAAAEALLRRRGHTVLNPARLPAGFEHHEYMRICLAMVDVCEGLYLLRGWENSDGAQQEYERATRTQKFIMFPPPAITEGAGAE